MTRPTILTCIILLFSFLALPVFGQPTTIQGRITDKISGDPMVGVSISIVDQLIGTITNEDGSFTLTTQVTPPFTIIVSMMGFQNKEIEIESALSNLDIEMEEQVYLGQEVVVSASRISESILKSPVSIEKINALQLQQTTSANFYDGLYNLKGVDMNIHSLTFRYPNTRGFTGDANYRMNQIIDGIENIPPGMSFSAGNIFGLSQLDVQSLELLVGASSALYGPGGMNGTLIMTSKNPYDFQGLSFTSQAGIMNINAAHPDGANPMGEFSFRYAKAFNDKLAIKITAGYLTATDWHAYDLRNKNDFNNPNATRLTNPGYDGINVYGDDIIVPVNLKDVAPQVAAGVAETRGLIPGTIEYDQEVQRIVDLFPDQVISRSGWQEKELVDYGTNNMRIGGSVHYRFNERFEAFVQGNYAQGTSVYTAQNRFSLKNFNIYTARAEIKSPDFFLRAYTTVDNSGDSFDAGGAALKLNEAWKPSEQWFTEYIENFATMLLMGNSDEASHQFARTVANNRDVNGNVFDPSKPSFPIPGTDYFNELYDPIINTPVSTGAQVLDKSKIVHAEGMYNLTRFVKIFD
ncbi:MAG: carboxypeptidase-like regulatory domain-containing protein, partial [Bacteroidales bacterium]|nr:carboxypeptidase-like regulatory domain-containing protein [Bacteroidales bacterium]